MSYDDALDGLHAAVEQVFGRAAVYWPPDPPGAPGVACVVVTDMSDAELATRGLAARFAAGVFEVLADAIPSPRRGGQLAVTVRDETTTWVVTDEPEMADPDRKVWTLRCELAS